MADQEFKSEIAHRFFNVLFKRKFLVISVFVVTILFTIAWTYLSTPIYKATAKILVNTNPRQQILMFKDFYNPAIMPPNVNPAQNMIEMSKSKALALELVEKFRLDEYLRKKAEEPEKIRDIFWKYFSQTLSAPVDLVKFALAKMGLIEKEEANYLLEAINTFVEDMQDVVLETDTQVINITIWAEKPSLSVDIANSMADSLLEKAKEVERGVASTAYEFASHEAGQARRKLTDSEDKLLRLMEKENIVSPAEEKLMKLQQLDRFKAEHTSLKIELAELEAQLAETNNQLFQQQEHVNSQTVFARNPLAFELKHSLSSLEMELASLLAKYSEQHREVEALKAQIDENRKVLEKEEESIQQSETMSLNSVYQHLLNQKVDLITRIESLLGKEKSLKAEIDRLQKETKLLAKKEIEIERIERIKQADEELFNQLNTKLGELQVAKVSQLSEYDLRIIDRAYIPKGTNPDWPTWEINLLVGVLAALVFALGLPFLIEYWNDSFHSAQQIERLLKLPVLATVSDFKE